MIIKLVASDIDGTLIPEGKKELKPEIYDIIRELKSIHLRNTMMFAVRYMRPYIICIRARNLRVNKRGFYLDPLFLLL